MEEVLPVEDMDEGAPYKCPALKVFRDIKGRRAALLKALTTDFEVLYQQCDPEKENLCLYGYPDGEWRVDLPVKEVPSDLPEPVLGINFRRDEMDKDEWLSLVATHSNAWLLSVAFYLGARAGFDKDDRNRIFNLINNLPTLFEVVIGKSSVSNQEEDEDEDEEDVADGEFDGSGEILCKACSYMSSSDDFWICCDSCEKWFHGECVKLTPGMLDHSKYYQCASCSNKPALP